MKKKEKKGSATGRRAFLEAKKADLQARIKATEAELRTLSK